MPEYEAVTEALRLAAKETEHLRQTLGDFAQSKTTPRGPEETRLLNRLFDDPDRKLLHFNVMIDPNKLRPTREQLCADVNRCLDAYERGECPVIESIDRDMPTQDVRFP